MHFFVVKRIVTLCYEMRRVPSVQAGTGGAEESRRGCELPYALGVDALSLPPDRRARCPLEAVSNSWKSSAAFASP